MSFEQDLKRLEKIVADIESGSLSLDENIKLYEEGVTISKKCLELLENAKGKISMINKNTGSEEEAV